MDKTPPIGLRKASEVKLALVEDATAASATAAASADAVSGPYTPSGMPAPFQRGSSLHTINAPPAPLTRGSSAYSVFGAQHSNSRASVSAAPSHGFDMRTMHRGSQPLLKIPAHLTGAQAHSSSGRDRTTHHQPQSQSSHPTIPQHSGSLAPRPFPINRGRSMPLLLTKQATPQSAG